MNYSPEYGVADLLTAYLKSEVDAETQAGCPIVAFYDPMSIDENTRCVVEGPDAESDPNCPGNLSVTVETGIRSVWAQESLPDDLAKHKARLNEIRDKLMPTDLVGRLNDLDPDGFTVLFVRPRRQFSSKTVEGFFYSGVTVTIEIATTA